MELITNVRNHANLWLLLQEQGKSDAKRHITFGIVQRTWRPTFFYNTLYNPLFPS